MWFCLFIFRPDYLDTVGNLLITVAGSVAVGYIGLQVADNTMKGKNYAWQMDDNMVTKHTKKDIVMNTEQYIPEQETITELEKMGKTIDEKEEGK